MPTAGIFVEVSSRSSNALSESAIVLLVWIDCSGQTSFDLMEDSSRTSSLSLSLVGLSGRVGSTRGTY